MIAAISQRFRRFYRADDRMKEVISNASLALVLKGLGAGLGFGFNILLGRMLGAEGTGLYYLSLSVISIATTVGRLGLDKPLLRFTAANATTGDWPRVSGLYRKGMWIAVGASVLASIAILIVAPWLGDQVFSEPDLVAPLRLMALSIPAMSLLLLHGELLKGLKKIPQALAVNTLGVPLLSIGFLALLGGLLGVDGAAIAYGLAALIVLLAGVILWRRATPELKGVKGWFDTHGLMSASLPLFWVAFAALLMAKADTFILGIWADSESVGVYGAAVRVANLTTFILLSVNAIASAEFASLHARGDLVALGRLARATARLMAIVAFVATLPLLIVPGWVLGLFGGEFVAGANALRIVAIGQLVNVAAGSTGPLLTMTGHERALQRIVMASVVVSIGLDLVLIRSYGIEGAATARSVSLVIMNALAVLAVEKQVGVRLLWSRQRR